MIKPLSSEEITVTQLLLMLAFYSQSENLCCIQVNVNLDSVRREISRNPLAAGTSAFLGVRESVSVAGGQVPLLTEILYYRKRGKRPVLS